MPDDVRQSQNIIEVLGDPDSTIRETQNIVEVLSDTEAIARVTQDVVEILSDTEAEARVSQNIVELILTKLELSGIYFINPKKSNYADSYNGGDNRKVPDPTVRTALIGE